MSNAIHPDREEWATEAEVLEDIEDAEAQAEADWIAQTDNVVDWLGDNVTGPIAKDLVANDPANPIASELKRAAAMGDLKAGWIKYATAGV